MVFYDIKKRVTEKGNWVLTGRKHTKDEAVAEKAHWKKLGWQARIVKYKDK